MLTFTLHLSRIGCGNYVVELLLLQLPYKENCLIKMVKEKKEKEMEKGGAAFNTKQIGL